MNVQEAYRSLSASQKPATGAPLYSLLVNRPLGRWFAAFAHSMGATPNQVTTVSAVFTFAAIVGIALAPPTWTSGVLIALGLVIGYALDSADGQVARLRGGGSLSGEWLDHFIDSAKVVSLHLAVAIMAFRAFDAPPWWLLVPLAFCVVEVVHFFGMLLTDLLLRTAPGTQTRKSGASVVMSLAKLPTDYGLLCLAFILLGWPAVFLPFYTVLAIANAGYTVLVAPVWFRRLKAAEPR